MEEKNEVYVDDKDLYGKNIKTIPKPETNIGIDTKDIVINKIADSTSEDNIHKEGIASTLDISAIESFTTLSQSRDQVYALLDTMGEDPTVAAALEIYAEDATEYNDQGRIVWAESVDSNIGKYITFLLDTLNIDKNVYKWVYNLCKYGDVYLRLFRKSDYEDKDVLGDSLYGEDKDDKILNEDVNIIKYSKNDKYAHYVEMVPNPANVFELTKHGKTYAYIKTNTLPTAINSDTSSGLNNTYSYITQYKFKKDDVDIHSPTDYVHATLDDSSSRTPEEVNIFVEDKETTDSSDSMSTTYTVNRGQSLLYNIYKIWRQMTLLENAILLNRLTKSSIVRIIGVEVGDMPKSMVGAHLQRIKSLIEQKAAINTSKSMSEYTNPGPVENNVYVPIHNEKGAINISTVGGDVDVGNLTDLDYFKNKFYGALGIPKQYMGDTEDGAGFNGGQSLSIISSRYAKRIKRIQNSICQMVTDAINLMLIDKGMTSYINKFTIHMLPPTTQEEIDRRSNISSKIQITGDIMQQLNDIDDPIIKLKILKALLANSVSDTDVVNLIQEQIDKLEAEQEGSLEGEGLETESEEEENEPLDLGSELGLEKPEEAPEGGNENPPEGSERQAPPEGENNLPSPEELGRDMTDNNANQ